MIMEQTQGNNEEQQQQKEEKPQLVNLSSSSDNNNKNEKQIILYNPPKINTPPPINDVIRQGVVVPVSVSETVSDVTPVHMRPRVLPSVGAFTVQCAKCFKWRYIPTQEKYEEIREKIIERPFVCEHAKEWRPEVSCDVVADIEQDGSRLWAIDKPSISKPPPGWKRELRIRGEGGSKFADVYYVSPTGKRLRSMVEVHKYLFEHPEFLTQGVQLSQFSFQIPKPLQENYVRKRPARITAPSDEPVQVNPLSWAAPDDGRTLQLGGPEPSSSYSRGTPTYFTPPAKKKPRSSSQHRFSNDSLHMQPQHIQPPHMQPQHMQPPHIQPHRFKIKGPQPPPNGVYDL